MPKKSISGSKTDRYINLILELAKAPQWMVNQKKLKTLLGNPSKSQFHNCVSELTLDYIDRPSVLCKIKKDNEIYYKLNQETFNSFYSAIDEGDFLLECHKKLGYLIDSGLTNIEFPESKSNKKNLNRKFMYLTAVQGKSFDQKQKIFLHSIIKALLTDTKLKLQYNNKLYSVYPVSLCQYRDEMYLIGFKSKVAEENRRVFKISRLTSIELSDETFSYPSLLKWNPEKTFKKTSGLILGDEIKAVINVYGHARKLIKEKDFFNSKLLNHEIDYDQYVCSLNSETEFLGQLFVYADEIELVQPVKLKEKFLEKLKKSLKLNSAA